MNKKIFTLLVGALLSFGSLFSVSAQTPTVHSKTSAVSFADTLRADTVRNLSLVKDAYYLLSITGIANPTIGPSIQAVASAVGSLRSDTLSYVLFVDEGGNLRFDTLSVLDHDYEFYYQGAGGTSPSAKMAAIRHASWCVDVNDGLQVAGSNAIFDFTNLSSNIRLQAPLNTTNPALWSAAEGYGRTVYKGSTGNNQVINVGDEDLIVSGWHFSQTFGSQEPQHGMPLYSYVKKDSVLVLVVENDSYQAPEGIEKARVGGWRVTVKYVAVNDLIANAQGDVRIGSPNAVNNVLLFTLKKLNKFVLNADDYNAIGEKLKFTPDAFNSDKNNPGWNPFTKPENDGKNPHAQGILTASEVSDSLYRYGYLQFQKKGGKDNEWLYVDTAFWNVGNDEFLGFAWDVRRDTVNEWGFSFAKHGSEYYPLSSGKPDTSKYFAKSLNLYENRHWRLDSLIWAVVDYFQTNYPTGIPGGNYINYTNPTVQIRGDQTITFPGTLTLVDILGRSDAGILWNNIVGEASLYYGGVTVFNDAVDVGTFLLTGTGLFRELFGTSISSQNELALYYASYFESSLDKRKGELQEAVKIQAAYKADSVLWPFVVNLDSLMENQSKFRVVYDPYTDSTFINVYQSRVLYTDYTDPEHPVDRPWWSNSFTWDGANVLYPHHGGGMVGVSPNQTDTAHSMQETLNESSPKLMDIVLISTADTVVFYQYSQPLSHIYGWRPLGNEPKDGRHNDKVLYKDSLFYVDIQNLEGDNYNRIATLDQANVGNENRLSTQITLNVVTRCKPEGPDVTKASIGNDLYLIRNAKGEYLSVPIYSITDSVYWRTPEQWEDPTQTPSYQWAVENILTSAGSPFKLTNREFENVSFDYVQVEVGTRNLLIGGKYSNARFAKEQHAQVYSKTVDVTKVDALEKGQFSRIKTDPDFAGVSFLPLAKGVKSDQLLGYTYVDPIKAVDVYAFKYLHFLASGPNANYLGWNGYDEPKMDSAVYVNNRDYHDKLYFALEEMPLAIMREDLKQGDGIKIDKNNTDYKSIYTDYGAIAGTDLVDHDYVIMERFGYMPKKTKDTYDYAAIKDLWPLARQAYRLLLKDYYKFSPTIRGDYMTVGDQDNYVLSDRVHAAKPYVPNSDHMAGIFGVPYFYFRNTYFDVPGTDQEGKDIQEDYFALVQRLDTISIYEGTSVLFEHVKYYIEKQWGPDAMARVIAQIEDSRELGAFIATVSDYSSARSVLKIAVRGDIAVAPSTFTLEKDEDPLYRRFHWNDNFDRTYNDDPLTLEFHRLNNSDYRLFENSGGDKRSGGGYDYNLNKNGQLQRDSVGTIINFLGMKNISQFPSVKELDDPYGHTNYAFYVDTAYIDRGTGWIKPQYMFVVDPKIVEPCLDCNPNTGKDDIEISKGYVLGRYMYNTSMYAKKVLPSAADIKDRGGVNYDLTQPIDVSVINTDIKSKVVSDYNGYAYTRSGDTKWERLAFAWAIHRGDELFVLKVKPGLLDNFRNDPDLLDAQLRIEYPGVAVRGETQIDFEKLRRAKGEIKGEVGLHAVIQLGDNTHKDWVFSFRYIQRRADDFIIESETTERDRVYGPVIRPGYGGWVKYDNNVPIITRSDTKELLGEGYVTNVTFAKVEPVSNAPVEGTSEIKVIGGDASISVLNASGKTVYVTNVLGQTLANTVLGSDNATIAIPAQGIVFVTIDGVNIGKVLVK
ncbi:MAG: DUF6383 domain-containing protein [Tannerella sp.]|nr:DUF6383 domain-containing protein [Tannerella sp.]